MTEPRKNQGPPLIAIGIMLLLALISQWLVFEKGWNSMWAVLAVVGYGFGLGVSVLGILLLIVGKNRAELLRRVQATMTSDLDGILRMFRLRK